MLFLRQYDGTLRNISPDQIVVVENNGILFNNDYYISFWFTTDPEFLLKAYLKVAERYAIITKEELEMELDNILKEPLWN